MMKEATKEHDEEVGKEKAQMDDAGVVGESLGSGSRY
jgi:hypothetical protein